MEQKFVLPSDCFVWRKGEDILVYNAATKAHVEAKVTDARIGEFCDHMDDLSKLNTDILDEADQANAPFTAFIDSLVAAGCGRVCPGDAWVFSLPARPFVNHNVERMHQEGASAAETLRLLETETIYLGGKHRENEWYRQQAYPFPSKVCPSADEVLDFISRSDSGNALGVIFVVADGMGGHNAGEVASEYAVDELLERLRATDDPEPVHAISDAVSYANAKVYEKAGEDIDKAGMGTTMVTCVLSGKHLSVSNVGDSRLYCLDRTSIRQITRDHSVVEELIRRGALSEEDAEFHKDRHKITRAVGAEPEVRTDFFDLDFSGREDEAILLCTDGLTNEVSDSELQSIIEGEGSLKEKVTKLIDTANSRRGADNITALVIFPFADSDEVEL